MTKLSFYSLILMHASVIGACFVMGAFTGIIPTALSLTAVYMLRGNDHVPA